MKTTLRKIVIATTVLVGILGATTLLAQGPGFRPGGMGYGPGAMMGGPGMMYRGAGPAAVWGDNPAERLEEIKTRLNILPEQEEAWALYQESLLSHLTFATAMHEGRWVDGTFAPSTVDERQAMFASRSALLAATTNLYGVLTAEQQGLADGLIGAGCPGGRFGARRF